MFSMKNPTLGNRKTTDLGVAHCLLIRIGIVECAMNGAWVLKKGLLAHLTSGGHCVSKVAGLWPRA